MGTLQRIAAFLLKLVLSASQCDLLVKLLDKRFAYYDNSAQDVNRGSRSVAVQGFGGIPSTTGLSRGAAGTRRERDLVSYWKVFVSIASPLLVFAPLGVAHHSAAAYDQTVTKMASGILKEFDWNSPHAGALVEYKNEKGEVVEVYATTLAPLQLIHQGFAPKDFKPGQKVELAWTRRAAGLPAGS